MAPESAVPDNPSFSGTLDARRPRAAADAVLPAAPHQRRILGRQLGRGARDHSRRCAVRALVLALGDRLGDSATLRRCATARRCAPYSAPSSRAHRFRCDRGGGIHPARLLGRALYDGSQRDLAGSSLPLFVVPLSWWLLKLTVGGRQLAGLALSLAGVACIISTGELQTLAQLAISPGDLLLLGGPLWAIYRAAGGALPSSVVVPFTIAAAAQPYPCRFTCRRSRRAAMVVSAGPPRRSATSRSSRRSSPISAGTARSPRWGPTWPGFSIRSSRCSGRFSR
jgi:hypothetical protein